MPVSGRISGGRPQVPVVSVSTSAIQDVAATAKPSPAVETPSTPCIVIDNGSLYSRVTRCVGHEITESCSFPTAVGLPTSTPMDALYRSDQRHRVGCVSEGKGSVLSIQRPVGPSGRIVNWDCMQEVWQHAFVDELGSRPDEHAVVLAEGAEVLYLKHDREKMAQVMFEDFGVPMLFAAQQSLLSLFGTGRTTGCVLNVGDGTPHVLPVYDGFGLRYAAACDTHEQGGAYGGSDITDLLVASLDISPLRCRSAHRTHNLVRDIKESLAFVTSSATAARAVADQWRQPAGIGGTGAGVGVGRFHRRDPNDPLGFDVCQYTLPDGQTVQVGRECFLAPEALFQPALAGGPGDDVRPGVQDLVRRSLLKCDRDIAPLLAANTVLAGGTTTMTGFASRLKQELDGDRLLAANGLAPDLVIPSNRTQLAIAGGSILASLSVFPSMAFTMQEYQESGPHAIHRVCCL
eukprot:m.60528 g.60528  ORF g.60528 m.60528 type:complete len:461 (-) comp13099_c0_seq1:92-1474(-)